MYAIIQPTPNDIGTKRELIQKQLTVPANVLGSNSTEPVVIRVIDYNPDSYGKEAYMVNCGWNTVMVEAEPIYNYWWNHIRRKEKLEELVGLKVIELTSSNVFIFGDVVEVIADEGKEILNVRTPEPDHAAIGSRLHPMFHNAIAITKAGLLRDLAIDIAKFNLAPSDLVLVKYDNYGGNIEELTRTLHLTDPFAYPKRGTMEGTRIMSDRPSFTQMAACSAEFDTKYQYIFNDGVIQSVRGAKLRCRVIAFDPRSNTLHIQVIACSLVPSVVMSVVAIDADQMLGVYTNMSMRNMGKVIRPLLNRDSFTNILEAQKRHIEALILRKGYGVFASKHEALGILQNELSELSDAIHDKLSDEEVIGELQDIATGALWAIASIRSGASSW